MSLKKFRKYLDSVHSGVKGQSTQISSEIWYNRPKPYKVPYERCFIMLSGDVIAFLIRQSIGELWAFQLVWVGNFPDLSKYYLGHNHEAIEQIGPKFLQVVSNHE